MAQSKTTIPATHAKGLEGDLPIIRVNTDYGSSISFLKTDEVIIKAWLGQTNAVEVGFDNSLGQAKIMYLKQDAKTEKTDGTSLTVITQNSQNKTQLYSFLLEFKPGKLANSIWIIEPEKESLSQDLEQEPKTLASKTPPQSVSSPPPETSETESPKQPKPQQISAQSESPAEGKVKSSSPVSEPSKQYADKPKAQKPTTPKAQKTNSQALNNKTKDASSVNNQGQANALVRGLVVANRQGQITSRSSMNRRVNSVVRSLRKGKDIRIAAQSANVSWSVIEQLLKWGQYESSLLSEN